MKLRYSKQNDQIIVTKIDKNLTKTVPIFNLWNQIGNYFTE